jgi:hypothetical protein
MKTYWITDFSGGQNSDLNPLNLKPNEFAVMKNAIAGSGILKKRPGLSNWCNDVASGNITLVRRMVDGIAQYVIVPATAWGLYDVAKDGTPHAITNPTNYAHRIHDTEFSMQTAVYENYTILSRHPYGVAANDDRMLILYESGGVKVAGLLGHVVPTGPTGGTAGAGGNLTPSSTYKHVMTFYDSTNKIESGPCDIVETALSSSQNRVTLNVVDGTGGYDMQRFYRTIANGEIFRFVAERSMAATNYVDDLADEDLANERLFAANHLDDPHKLMYSNVGHPGSIPTDNFFEMPDKQPIYGIHALGDRLVILSDGLVRVLHIRGHPTEWILTDPLIQDGPFSYNCSCSCDNFIAFIGRGGVYLYDGMRFINIVEKKIRSSLYGPETHSNNWIEYDPINRRLYVCIKQDDDPQTNEYYCYHFDSDAWVEWETASALTIYSHACTDKEGRVVIARGNGADTYWLDDVTPATDDDGTAITTVFKTGILDFGTPDATKLIRSLYIDLDWDKTLGQDGELRAILYDEKGNSTTRDYQLPVDADTDRIRISLVPVNGKTIQLQISDQGQFDKFDVRGIGFEYVERRHY